MRIERKREFQHQYMTVQVEEEINRDSYPVRMLLGNCMEELLPCQVQYADGEASYCFDVTGGCNVEEYLEGKKVSSRILEHLMEKILHITDELERYLLQGEGLLLRADTIYYMDDGNMRFCYLPTRREDVGQQLQELMEYLLPLVDHKDERGTTLAYAIYKDTMSENFMLEKLRKRLYEREEEHVIEPEEKKEDMEEELLRRQAMDSFFGEDMEDKNMEEKKKKRIPWESMVISVLWTVALLGICAMKYLGMLEFLTLPVMVVIFLLTLLVLGVNLFLWKRAGRKAAADNADDAEEMAVFSHARMAQGSIQWAGKQEETLQETDADFTQNAEVYPDFVRESKTAGRNPVMQPKPLLGDTQPLPIIPVLEGELLVSQNPEKGPNIPISSDLIIVGKMEESADVVIPSATVSRLHARLRKVEDELYIMDLHSKNGTYVNGERLDEKENRCIVPGDCIAFADVEYVLAQ